jgi:hypothetical protein
MEDISVDRHSSLWDLQKCFSSHFASSTPLLSLWGSLYPSSFLKPLLFKVWGSVLCSAGKPSQSGLNCACLPSRNPLSTCLSCSVLSTRRLQPSRGQAVSCVTFQSLVPWAAGRETDSSHEGKCMAAYHEVTQQCRRSNYCQINTNQLMICEPGHDVPG